MEPLTDAEIVESLGKLQLNPCPSPNCIDLDEAFDKTTLTFNTRELCKACLGAASNFEKAIQSRKQPSYPAYLAVSGSLWEETIIQALIPILDENSKPYEIMSPGHEGDAVVIRIRTEKVVDGPTQGRLDEAMVDCLDKDVRQYVRPLVFSIGPVSNEGKMAVAKPMGN